MNEQIFIEISTKVDKEWEKLSTSKNSHKVVLKPSGWDQIIMLLLIGIIAVPSCIIIGLRYGTIDYYIWIPLAILIALGVTGLTVIKLFNYSRQAYDTITFSNKGIRFENKRTNVSDEYPWEKVEGIVIKEIADEGESFKVIEILLSESVRIVKLKVYSSIATTEEQLYNRIMNVYRKNDVSLLILDN